MSQHFGGKIYMGDVLDPETGDIFADIPDTPITRRWTVWDDYSRAELRDMLATLGTKSVRIDIERNLSARNWEDYDA